jgi:hypothetical protein
MNIIAKDHNFDAYIMQNMVKDSWKIRRTLDSTVSTKLHSMLSSACRLMY